MTVQPSSVSLLGKIAEYTEALAKDPRSPLFVPLAETYRQMGLLDDALQVARDGTARHPEMAAGYTTLGKIHGQRGEMDEAASFFQKALAVDGRDLNALRGLVRVRLHQGNKAEAAGLLRRILTLRPDDAGARDLLSRLESASKPAPPVAKIHSSPPSPPPRQARSQAEPISTATIAEIYIKQGYLRRAMRVYRDILFVDPYNEDVRGKLIALKNEVEAREKRQQQTAAATAPPAAPAAPEPEPTAALPGPDPPSTSPLESTLESTVKQDRSLGQFQRWLEAIGRRRGHVS